MGSSPTLGTIHLGACSSVGLERSPAKAEVVGSSPPRRASGRLAQRLERLSYTQKVTGSNPVLPTTHKIDLLAGVFGRFVGDTEGHDGRIHAWRGQVHAWSADLLFQIQKVTSRNSRHVDQVVGIGFPVGPGSSPLLGAAGPRRPNWESTVRCYTALF